MKDTREECPECYGYGTYGHRGALCGFCHGTGKVTKEEADNVRAIDSA